MPSDYEKSAIRHYSDAAILYKIDRLDNAGHLIGFAAECALKSAAIKFLKKGGSDIDGHLPKLKKNIRLILDGRNIKGPLLQIVSSSDFFSEWHVNNRYEADGHVKKILYDKWLTQTNRVFSAAKIKREIA